MAQRRRRLDPRGQQRQRHGLPRRRPHGEQGGARSGPARMVGMDLLVGS